MERADEPENMYFLETQSDWQQNPDMSYGFEWDKDYETKLKSFEADIKGIEDKIAQYKEALNDQDNLFGQEIIKDRIQIYEHDLGQVKQKLRNYKKDASPGTQKQFLREKTQERLIQEEFITAAAAGKDYVLFPTRETAAKIQGYDWNKGSAKSFIRRYERDLPDDAQHIIDNYLPDLESDVLTNIDNIKAFENLPEVKQYKLNSDKSMYFELHDKARDLITKRNRVNKFKNELNNATDKAAFENQVIYNPDHETVLKKYDDKPKLYKKLTGQEPVPYTDPDGNTWMKVKIPEKIKKGQGEIRAFKQGGYVDKLSKFIR
jgi:hypothetical protein